MSSQTAEELLQKSQIIRRDDTSQVARLQLSRTGL